MQVAAGLFRHLSDVSDGTNRVVTFDSALAPATFWVKLDDLGFEAERPGQEAGTLPGGKRAVRNPPAAERVVLLQVGGIRLLRQPLRL